MPIKDLQRRVARIRAPLAAKLHGGFLLVIAVLLATGVVSLVVIAGIRKQASDLDTLEQSVSLALGLDHSIVVQEHVSSMFLLTMEESYATKMVAEGHRFRKILAQLGTTGVSPGEIDRIEKAFDRYESAGNMVRELRRAAKEREARDLHVAQEHTIAHEIEALTKPLVDRMKAMQQVKQGEIVAAEWRASWTVAGFFLFSVALAVTLGSLLARTILYPIRRVDEALERIAGGEFVNVSDVVNQDELGSLVSNVNRMSERLADLYASERRTASELQKQLVALSRTQAQLRQAQKMEAIGQLAGGIAHDFNNLLTIIGGRTQLMLSQLSRLRPDDLMRRNIELVKNTADRATSLTRQLLAFSRKQLLQPKVLDLSVLVAELLPMLRLLTGEHINLVTLTDPTLGRVKADPSQIEQVILNLTVNARDAMPDGGTLTIETSNGMPDQESDQREVVQTGPGVRLVVRDTGVGMNAEIQAHLFEPFFTTKGPGKGTGLGLATAYGIIKQSGGHVWVSSEPGKGTTVTVWLPQVGETVESPLGGDGEAQPRGMETVLLVEDDADVRGFAREVLQDYGYKVLEAKDGEEALRLDDKPELRLDLIVTDVVMPRMGGRELARRLAARHMSLKVLYMSGYPDDALGQHGVLESGTMLLQKPFMPEELARKVREVLGASRPPADTSGSVGAAIREVHEVSST